MRSSSITAHSQTWAWRAHLLISPNVRGVDCSSAIVHPLVLTCRNSLGFSGGGGTTPDQHNDEDVGAARGPARRLQESMIVADHSVYLIDRTGRVAFRALWAGQEGLLRDKIKELIEREVAGEDPVNLGQPENLLIPLIHGAAEFDQAA